MTHWLPATLRIAACAAVFLAAALSGSSSGAQDGASVDETVEQCKASTTDEGLFGGLVGSFFPADTTVHVRPAGAGAQQAQLGKTELKPIGQLKPGDEVLALAEWKEPGQARTDTGDKLDARLSWEKVTHVFTSTREQRLVHLTLDNGETLTATDGHPLKTPEGWRDAILLKRGGQLLLKGAGSSDGGAASLRLDAAARSGPQERVATIVEVRVEHKTLPVFNLEVSNAHTFFVGELGLLAHNAWVPPATEGHHTIPREIQKRLPQPVQSHPDVVGRKGLPNIKCIKYRKHRDIHDKNYPGGDYNAQFDREITARGGYGAMTPSVVTSIRDLLVRRFGI